MNHRTGSTVEAWELVNYGMVCGGIGGHCVRTRTSASMAQQGRTVARQLSTDWEHVI